MSQDASPGIANGLTTLRENSQSAQDWCPGLLSASLVQIRFLEDEESLLWPREKTQVPPLRYATVGMTILLRGPRLFRRIYSGLYRIVIVPTGSGGTVA